MGCSLANIGEILITEEEKPSNLGEISPLSYPLSITIEYDKSVNFAIQQNLIPVIKRIKIYNRGIETYRDIHLGIISDPEFSDHFDMIISKVSPGETFTIHTVPLVLSHQFFQNVISPLQGSITGKITHNNTILGKNTFPIRILAYDQWNGLRSIPELLSAFITPNVHAITTIIKQAQDILREWTGNSSFTDYQTNDIHRVRMMAAAVYAAIQNYHIRYATPEAGFELEGQKIRLVDKLIEDKMGNCLDLTLLFASCIERIGLHPLIVIIEGHAFAGVWLINDTFSDVTIEELLPLRKRVDLQEIAVIDMVTATNDAETPFESSELSAVKHLSDERTFQCVIDVKTSRNGKYHIIPIPVGVEDTTPIPDPKQPEPPDGSTKTPLPPTVHVTGKKIRLEPKRPFYPRLDKWMNNLLDLSLRNHLLNFQDSQQIISLLVPDIAKLEDSISEGRTFRIKHFDHKGEKITPHSLLPHDTLTIYFSEEIDKYQLFSQLSEIELNKRLLNIYKQAKKSLEETGAETLYLALGTLVWYESDISDKALHAPIILIPLEIVRKDVTTGFSIRIGDDEPRINNTLLQRIYQDFQIEIPHIDPLPMDEHGLDVSGILYQFRKSMKNLHRWDVLNTATISHFTFLKYLMWRDLYTYSEQFMENVLVSNLVDSRLFPFPKKESFLKPAILDDQIKPSDVFCPIGVDSSQLAAVIAAGEGKTFVLHGPPGTGKSQTITNIISHCLALGKTVLFVSEKRVALDVVHTRLKESGLESFCLELHSNKSHKREVLNQFEKILDAQGSNSSEDWSMYADYIADLRLELNNYVHAIHKVRQTGESFYQGMVHLIGLRDVEHISLSWPPLSAINRETLREIQTLVHDIQIITQHIVHPRDNIWRPAQCAEWNVRWKSSVDKNLQDFEIHIRNLINLFPILCEVFGFDPEKAVKSRLHEIRSITKLLLETKYNIPSELLDYLQDPEAFEGLKEFIELGAERDNLYATILQKYHEDIFTFDFTNILLKLGQIPNVWILKRKSLIREIIDEIHRFCYVIDIGIEEIEEDISCIQYFNELHAELSNHSEIAETIFGPYWTGEEEDWETLKIVLNKAEKIKTVASQLTSDPEEYKKVITAWSSFTHLLLSDTPEKDTTVEQCSQYEQALNGYFNEGKYLSGLLQYDPITLWTKQTAFDLLHIQLSTVQAWEKEISQLKNWCQWNLIRNVAIEKGFSPIIQRYEDATADYISIENLIYRSYYHWWVDGLREKDHVLRQFYRPKFEDSIQKFKDLDRTFTALTRQEIEARLFAGLPKGLEETEALELGILRHQIQLQRKHMPVRSLFKSIPNILFKYKPCMLMSPISVAQYLDPECISFDLVVFDEASQIPVSDAMGAIARGTSTIIVGDPKQLPPTNIFQKMNDADEDDYASSTVDLDSILDECIASNIPQMHLEWHYRSRHESLIAFSNYHFYKNSLLTFPSPDKEPAISLINTLGIFDSGYTRTNRVEAEAVVKEIIRRLRDPVTSSDSIGVITFNERQQDLIQTLLEKERRSHPEIEPYFSDDRSDAVFIKNLENVQGDERDTILFSVGYGPDAFGKISLNFGPLNRDGGERRLNVAITRAKREIVVFSSLRPEHIDLSRTQKTGVKLLKSFLEFAEKGPKAIAETCQRYENSTTSPFEKEVIDALSDKGYSVHSQVGCGGYRIDIAVQDPDTPGRFMLGILCDGVNYQEAKSARDRDILTMYVLEQLGWKIHRVWSTDWWDEKENEINRIVQLIEVIRSEYSPETMVYSQEEDDERGEEIFDEGEG